jgi:2-desacetyl-2-hydroxyethyl bacteriochlorophyllide A dehydrogenase
MQAYAAVATQQDKVEFQAVEAPNPDANDVVVHVLHSWISNGTEGSFVRGERIGGDTPRKPTDPLPFPHAPGYQKVGVIEWVGSDVKHLRVGDIVFATVSKVSGLFYPFAGHISPAVTHQSQIWKLPEGVPPHAASGLVLTQVGYNVGMRPTLQVGDAAVVIGDGMVGHWAAQTLQHRGARVLLLGKHDDRLARFAMAAGDRIVNTTNQDPVAAVREWAPKGVQVVADTVGTIPTIEALLPTMRRNSHISSAGFYGSHGLIDIQKLRDYEITLHAPAGWTKDRMDATLDLLAQSVLQTLPLITHRFPATRASEAYDLILSRRAGVLGVLLDWE